MSPGDGNHYHEVRQLKEALIIVLALLGLIAGTWLSIREEAQSFPEHNIATGRF